MHSSLQAHASAASAQPHGADAPRVELPLSAAQHGIWLGQQLDPDSPAYNTAECIEIHGPIDPVHFEAALRQVMHEAQTLRMAVVAADGSRQRERAMSDWRFVYRAYDAGADWLATRAGDALASAGAATVETAAADAPDAAARAWMDADMRTPVDLARGPLFAHALFQCAADRYLWYFRAHHIALDGLGFSLVARRVAAVYSARMQGTAARSPAAFGPLEQVVREDLAYLGSDDYQRDRGFWIDQMSDIDTPATLARRAAPVSRTVVRDAARLDPALHASLQAAARGARTTWPALMLLATSVYLGRSTGASELVLGLPVMARLGSAAMRVPCMAMNIVPLRLPVPAEGEFAAGLAQVTQLLARVRPHQRYRYEHLRRELGRVGGDRRLFGPVVNLMPFDHPLSFAGHPATTHNLSAGPVEDLSIGVRACAAGGPGADGAERAPTLKLELDGNPACYRADELAAHRRGLCDTLAEIADNLNDLDGPTAPRASARPVRAAHAGALIAGECAFGPARSVCALLLERAARHGEDTAVVCGDTQLSYAQLVAAASALALELRRRGAGPETLVAVLLPRSAEAIVAIVAVLLAGGAYLALDPDAPRSRNQAIDEHAAPALVVTDETAGNALGDAIGTRAVRVDQILGRRDRALGVTPALPTEFAPDSLAYVIYTSGSTGAPKGVQVEHDALAHFVAGAMQRYRVRHRDRVLQFAPLHFDASIEEIFVTLCAGATLVLRASDMLDSVPRFLEACAAQAITVLDLPTAYWHELAYSISTGAATLPPCVHTVIIGGEAALPERVARWRSSVASLVALLNTYGPSEATIVATVAMLAGPDPIAVDGDEVPIGLPLGNTGAAVLDRRAQPVPRGAIGELYLTGPSLARGYLGRDDLSESRFVTLQHLPGTPRAYRTGDLVRQRADGQLVFIGRVDDECKISGHRVSPAEIETVLAAAPGVREAAVIARDEAGSKYLAAHVAADAPAPTPAELRQHLRAALPPALVPSAIHLHERLPRNPAGKIDRAALARAQVQAAVSDAAPAAPMSPGERQVLEVWHQVLGLNALRPEDDFFALGGQSLQSIQVANRLGVALGRDVPVALLFRYPTAAGLAWALEHELAPAASAGPRDGRAANPGLSPLLSIAGQSDEFSGHGQADETTTRTPLFCVHPAAGLSWSYLALTRHLDSRRAVYGIQSPALSGDAATPEGYASLADLASDYVARIRAVQPSGPYALLGWSMGGVIAHAMAARLQAQGHEVALLALLDAYPRESWPEPRDSAEREAMRALLHIAGPRVTGDDDAPDDTIGDASDDAPGTREQLRARLAGAGSALRGLGDDALDALVAVATRNVELLRTAQHRPFRGDAVLFTARQTRTQEGFSGAAWKPHIDGCIESIEFECSHATILQDDRAEFIGQAVERRLNERDHRRDAR
ncbi:non-ribosomal peptide synthetase [Haliangium ochraceum]|uniref:Amino acid adenylation domain protein n=1 Tax=Haliangium ochraceum (strain DSM 14365 / JCM 11303 / SMP-2) TaxID=502025 RepID=D0LFW0_HALO1|nr:non-ribosomal peptide synthetase [Haliangium ochraceum]ACY14562.1 amino acid adenylation domain protein [Haliangium ochraceum DSM 14365]